MGSGDVWYSQQTPIVSGTPTTTSIYVHLNRMAAQEKPLATHTHQRRGPTLKIPGKGETQPNKWCNTAAGEKHNQTNGEILQRETENNEKKKRKTCGAPESLLTFNDNCSQ